MAAHATILSYIGNLWLAVPREVWKALLDLLIQDPSSLPRHHETNTSFAVFFCQLHFQMNTAHQASTALRVAQGNDNGT